MKKIILSLVGLIALMLFSGCAAKDFKVEAQKAVEKYVDNNGLRHKVSTVCYDLLDKKACPTGTLQYDIQIVYWLPASRFCLGAVDSNATMPTGMYCYHRDIVEDK